MSCTDEEPCPIFLELTAANQAGKRILAAGNIHSESVTIYSVLLASDDGGHTWNEAHERIRGSGLDHIHFFDSEIGWAIGQELFPIPQIPFYWSPAMEERPGGCMRFSTRTATTASASSSSSALAERRTGAW